MVTNNGEKKVQPIKNITVNPDTIAGSVYAQIVSVTVTDADITLEFVYLNPRPPADKGHVVSRVTLPRIAGEGLAKAIIETIKQHEEKKKKK